MFKLRELTKWFGVTVFELIMFLSSLLIYTIFLSFKVDGWLDVSWWFVHSPLFLCDALLGYFAIIVFIRNSIVGLVRRAFFQSFWSINQIVIMFTTKLFLCLRLEGDRRISHGEIWALIFFYLLLLIVRTCHLR